MALVITSLQGVQPGSRLRGEQLAPACFQPAVSHALVVGTTPWALSMLEAVAALAGVVVGAGGFVVGIVAAAVPVAAIGAVLDDGAVGAEQVDGGLGAHARDVAWSLVGFVGYELDVGANGRVAPGVGVVVAVALFPVAGVPHDHYGRYDHYCQQPPLGSAASLRGRADA